MRSFGDWRPIRSAIEAAYHEMGEDVPSSIPERDWNLAGLAITLHEQASLPKCAECKEPFDNWHSVIRCLDCKAPLCERCAPRHFWPNGRPAASPHPSAPDAGVREALMKAAERVCWYDWSDNDDDAVNAIEGLRAALSLAAKREQTE